MSETGSESYAPGEGGSSAPEQLSEEAKQRFAAAAAAMQAIQREEKKSKKRDSRVAKTIIQFLSDDRYAHLFVLISRLVARDCPSIFILGILSLINEDSKSVTEEYLKESGQNLSDEAVKESMKLAKTNQLDTKSNALLVAWITRLQMILSLETLPILTKLMIDEHNIDGTVLQLTTFVLQEFFRSEPGGSKEIPFENLHSFTASILQTVFEPFMDSLNKHFLDNPKKKHKKNDDDEDD